MEIKNLKNKALTALVAGAIAIAPIGAGYSYFHKRVVQTTINDAQMVKVDGKYMIATDYNPVKNCDAWYRGKFNSGTIQNEAIKLKGKKVEMKVYGWRIPFTSQYENVRELKELRGK